MLPQIVWLAADVTTAPGLTVTTKSEGIPGQVFAEGVIEYVTAIGAFVVLTSASFIGLADNPLTAALLIPVTAARLHVTG